MTRWRARVAVLALASGCGASLAGAQPVVVSPPPMAPPPLIPPATIDNTLEITGESIAAREIQSRMAINVQVDGQGPFRFLVDSGADRTVIGAALARRLALPPDRQVTLHGTAGTSLVQTVRIKWLQVGTSEIRDIVAPALPETFLGADGLLGIDALADQRLLLDFQARTVIIQDTRGAAGASADEIVVTARRRNGQLILTRVKAGRQELYAVIDSGSEVTMGNSALRAKIFSSHQPPRSSPVTLISVTGQSVTADMVVLPSLDIGAVHMQNVPVAFADVPPFELFGLANQPAILLGSDVLQTFQRVSLDFRHRKVRFRLRR